MQAGPPSLECKVRNAGWNAGGFAADQASRVSAPISFGRGHSIMYGTGLYQPGPDQDISRNEVSKSVIDLLETVPDRYREGQRSRHSDWLQPRLFTGSLENKTDWYAPSEASFADQPAKDIPAKLTTLRSSMFHCSYLCKVPRACGTAFKNVYRGDDPHHFKSSCCS